MGSGKGGGGKDKSEHRMEGKERSEAAQEIERKYRYRTMILRGQIALPREAAVKMIGPDCAYHLYTQHKGNRQE